MPVLFMLIGLGIILFLLIGMRFANAIGNIFFKIFINPLTKKYDSEISENKNEKDGE
jgi:hypothetical protein